MLLTICTVLMSMVLTRPLNAIGSSVIFCTPDLWSLTMPNIQVMRNRPVMTALVAPTTPPCSLLARMTACCMPSATAMVAKSGRLCLRHCYRLLRTTRVNHTNILSILHRLLMSTMLIMTVISRRVPVTKLFWSLVCAEVVPVMMLIIVTPGGPTTPLTLVTLRFQSYCGNLIALMLGALWAKPGVSHV